MSVTSGRNLRSAGEVMRKTLGLASELELELRSVELLGTGELRGEGDSEAALGVLACHADGECVVAGGVEAKAEVAGRRERLDVPLPLPE